MRLKSKVLFSTSLRENVNGSFLFHGHVNGICHMQNLEEKLFTLNSHFQQDFPTPFNEFNLAITLSKIGFKS